MCQRALSLPRVLHVLMVFPSSLSHTAIDTAAADADAATVLLLSLDCLHLFWRHSLTLLFLCYLLRESKIKYRKRSISRCLSKISKEENEKVNLFYMYLYYVFVFVCVHY